MKKLQRAIELFLNSRGYYRAEMPEGSSVSEAEIHEMFKTYNQSEVFKRFLRDMCAQDIRLYFQAVDDLDRNKLRGAWGRTNYFISLINKTNDKRNK